MEEIYTVRCGTYNIRTIVTARAASVRKWITSIKYHRSRFYYRSRLIVGLGVQWVPRKTSAAILQLCVGRRCLIFKLDHASNCPVILRKFLRDPNVFFVGLANFKDSEMLMDSRHHLRVWRLVDVKVVASDFRGCDRGSSMGKLAVEILGMPGLEKDENVGRSRWDLKRLSTDQVTYACHDVFLAFLMAKVLRVWNGVDDD